MKQALISSMLSIVLLTACSANNTPQTQYYLLNSPTLIYGAVTDYKVSKKSVLETKSNEKMAVLLLELPDYLKQANLVLQLSDHQLHYSNFHMWAEPLQSSFTQALALELNSLENHFQYIALPEMNQATTAKTLVVNVTSFHATHQSQAMLSGSYWLQDNTAQKPVASHNFDVKIALNKDGYEHAVAQMRAAISQLAKQVSYSLTPK